MKEINKRVQLSEKRVRVISMRTEFSEALHVSVSKIHRLVLG